MEVFGIINFDVCFLVSFIKRPLNGIQVIYMIQAIYNGLYMLLISIITGNNGIVVLNNIYVATTSRCYIIAYISYRPNICMFHHCIIPVLCHINHFLNSVF
jgi:hypothetical protein